MPIIHLFALVFAIVCFALATWGAVCAELESPRERGARVPGCFIRELVMTFNWRKKIFHIGPLVSAGRITLCRLWLWDFMRVGRLWKIARHTPWEVS